MQLSKEQAGLSFPEGPQEAGAVSQQESQGVQQVQSPALGKEQTNATVLDGKQLCRIGPGGAGWLQAEDELVSSCGKKVTVTWAALGPVLPEGQGSLTLDTVFSFGSLMTRKTWKC